MTNTKKTLLLENVQNALLSGG